MERSHLIQLNYLNAWYCSRILFHSIEISINGTKGTFLQSYTKKILQNILLLLEKYFKDISKILFHLILQRDCSSIVFIVSFSLKN